ncbi:putative beta-glucosidase btgE [Halenospora varia]|nr:putative beta-glucosidase btgE [Halenospora varia]
MKAGVLAIAAAIVVGVSARQNHAERRHAHELFHNARGLKGTGVYGTGKVTGTGKHHSPEETCGCTTIYTTITGEGTLYFPPPPATSVPPPPSSSAAPPTSTTTKSVVIVSTSPPVVPTPLATTCPTPGVYTIPATTITLTSSTTVCAATSTALSSGSNTYGGVTTVVSTKTTVVCPYATVSTSEGVVTSVISTTTYVCPSAGTYTIAPLTTSVSTSTVLVYPTPATYAPGTYTQAEVVTTITETNYVVVCPFTSPAPVPTSSAAPVVVSVAPPASTSVYVAPPASTSAAAPAKTSSSNSGSLGSSGNQWAITYSPYTSAGGCKGAADVLVDVTLIAASGFKAVRIYSTDCSGLVNVGTACKALGLRIILGVFISETGISGAQQQVTDIISWGQFGMVDLVVIGNEAVFNGHCTAAALAGFISECKTKFAAAGYSGPCTTTEPLNTWQANTGALCGAVDVVGANIHPFFNSGISASDAGSFVASQLQIVDGLCPGKTGINLETGWPSQGSCNGAACPGKSEQATAIKGITAAVGGKSVMFSFTNDPWKPAGEFGCEQYWGAVHLFSS